jgi:hypothetical protein
MNGRVYNPERSIIPMCILIDADRIPDSWRCGSELGPVSVDRSGLDRDRADVDRWIRIE